MLHIAPEPGLASRLLKAPGLNYLSIDLHDPQAMMKMDVTHLEFPENSFDIIYCSHVLEHVPDDRRALAEMLRVLKPAGKAIIMVPITVDETREDLSLTDAVEREKLFGQHDHVRRYGPDFMQRLVQAGFTWAAYKSADIAQPGDIIRLGLPANETIILCQKI
jgi:predicted SAM-dependent methyltransferase